MRVLSRFRGRVSIALVVAAFAIVLRASAEEQGVPRVTLPRSATAASPLAGGSRTPDASAYYPIPWMPEDILFAATGETPAGLLGGSSRTPDASAYRPDPAFDRFIDPGTIGKAWDSLDPAGLTDGALALMEGERVLLREHRCLPARDVAAVAVRLAAEKGDQASLDRLEKAAQQHGQAGLEKLAADARKAGGANTPAAIPLDIAGVSPEQYRLCSAVSRAATRAHVTGDARYILPIVTGDGEVVLPGGVPDAASLPLRRRVAGMCGDLSEQPGSTGKTLDLLAAASRFDGGTQRKEAPPRPPTPAVPPSVITGAY